MGWWKTERGLGGDQWADTFGGMMKELQGQKRDGHEINLGELADLVEFCSCGQLKAEVVDPSAAERPISDLHGKDRIETLPNRGQIHCQDETCDLKETAPV